MGQAGKMPADPGGGTSRVYVHRNDAKCSDEE